MTWFKCVTKGVGYPFRRYNGAMRGQSTVEYLLAISVITVALAAAMAVAYTAVQGGTESVAGDMAVSLTEGELQ